MPKQRIYTTSNLNTDVSWDIDKSFAFTVKNNIIKSGGSDSRRKSGDAYYTEVRTTTRVPTRADYIIDGEDPQNYIMFIFSKKYPINIEFRQKDKLVQDYDENIPYLQILEDILIKGSRILRIEKSEIRKDGDVSRLTDTEKKFYDFLQNKKEKSFRNFILDEQYFKLGNTPATVKGEIIKDDNTLLYQVSKVFFSDNNIYELADKYKFKVFAGTIRLETEETKKEIFDYSTDKKLPDRPSSKHLKDYWNHILLDEKNILGIWNELYLDGNGNEYYTRDTEYFPYVHFDNLFPHINDNNNPLLIKITKGYKDEDYSEDLEYEYEYGKDKPNRNGTKRIKVDNPWICFTKMLGFFRQYDNKLFFIPTDRNCSIEITDYNEENNLTTFKILFDGGGATAERTFSDDGEILGNVTKTDVGKKGEIYISKLFNMRLYL